MSGSVFEAFAESVNRYAKRPFLHLVSDTAQRYGRSPGSISYAEAERAVAGIAAAYQQMGVKGGQRVALALDNRPEFFEHWLALNALGVSVVPLNPQWRSGELEYVLGHSDAAHAVALPDRVAAIEAASQASGGACAVHPAAALAGSDGGAVLRSADLQAECALLYTSGTTGKPKGCMLSNEYFLCTGQWYIDVGGYCALRPGEDRLITPLPMYHMNAMATSATAMIMSGSCSVPLDRFHPSTWWQSVAESEATIMHYLGVMPAILMGMPETEQDRAHNIRFGFGAGLSGELHTAFEARFGINLIEAWAMTETGCTVAVIASEEPRKVGTACFGRPPAHMDYRLVDDAGEDVPDGQPGELLVRRHGEEPRYGFFSGYLKDDSATAEAWAEGYFHTGDLVYRDEDGLLHFVDRKKNVIRRSGENISAVEVEEVIMEHPAVKAVGVAAVPDELRGDEVFACVVADCDADGWAELARAIQAHCLGRLAYYKAPGYLSQVPELPLTPTEKIQRAGLKELARALMEGGRCEDLRDGKVANA